MSSANKWTKKELDKAIKALRKCASTKEVKAKTGHTYKAIEAALARNDLPSPSSFFNVKKEASKQLLDIPRETRQREDDTTYHKIDKAPKSIICDGDNHYPIHDPYVENAKLKFAQAVKPETWVNLGDQYDCWSISVHNKEAHRWFDKGGKLQEEFDSAQDYWKTVLECTQKDVHLILGNHENRLEKLINANLGFFNLKAFEWHRLADIDKKINIRQYATQLKIGPIFFEHGDKIGGKFGVKHPASWLLDNKGNRNTIIGHHHRFSVASRTVYDEFGDAHSYVAISQGHGSDVKRQTYIYEPSWTHGFTYIEFWQDKNKTYFTAHPITIVNGKFSFNGKIYDGTKL